jgi:hypothetical protein
MLQKIKYILYVQKYDAIVSVRCKHVLKSNKYVFLPILASVRDKENIPASDSISLADFIFFFGVAVRFRLSADIFSERCWGRFFRRSP